MRRRGGPAVRKTRPVTILATRGGACALDRAALDAIAACVNNRPREVLGWRTPAEVLAACRPF